MSLFGAVMWRLGLPAAVFSWTLLSQVILLRSISAENMTLFVIPDFAFEAEDETNTTKVSLNITCDATEIIMDLRFDEPFLGQIMMENDQKARGCSFLGNGSVHYRFEMPLLSCKTKRSGYNYTNSMMIMYDQKHIMEMGDQRKIILCQYPVPIAPPFLEIQRGPSLNGAINICDSQGFSRIFWVILLSLFCVSVTRNRILQNL